MSVSDTKDGGGANPSAGSANSANNDSAKPDETSDDEPKNDWHKRALADLKKAQAKAREAEAKLQAIEAKEREREEDELVKKGEFEKALAAKKAEAQRLEAELAGYKRQEENRRKLAAVLTHVGGNIDRKFWDLIDAEDVVIDSTTGEVDTMSVQSVAEKFKATYPEIIRKPGGAQTPNHAPTGGASGKISATEWRKLPAQKMKEYKPDQIDFDL